MAATATRYDTTKIRAGNVGQLWANVGLPGAAAGLTLASDGTPDSVSNPNAVHLGHTAAGTEATFTESVTDHRADEVAYPIMASPNESSGMMKGELIQIFDEEMLKIVTKNFGAYTNPTGHKRFTFGTPTSLTYYTFALIWPTQMDATKFAYVLIYSGLQVGGLTIKIDRTGRSQTPFEIKAYALTSRAAGDQLGQYDWAT